MKKIFVSLLIILFSITFSLVNAQSINNDTLLQFVKEINKRAPIRSSDGVTILSATVQGNSLIYKMHARDDITQDAANILFNSNYKKMMCLQEAEAFWLKKGVTLVWNYVDKKGMFLANITIKPQDCSYKKIYK